MKRKQSSVEVLVMDFAPPAVNKAVAVGTTPVLLSVARKWNEVIIGNTSTAGQVITLSFGAPAVASAGAVIYPTAAYSSPEAKVFEGEIWAVADAAGGQVSFLGW